MEQSRKLAHVFEFFVLTLLLYRAFRQDVRGHRRWRWVALSFLLALGMARGLMSSTRVLRRRGSRLWRMWESRAVTARLAMRSPFPHPTRHQGAPPSCPNHRRKVSPVQSATARRGNRMVSDRVVTEPGSVLHAKAKPTEMANATVASSRSPKG